MITDPDSGWVEPTVVINGRELSFAEAMALRVAVQTFALQLSSPVMRDGLAQLGRHYQQHLTSIERMMRGER